MVGVPVQSPGCVGEVFVGVGAQQRCWRCWKWLGWLEGLGEVQKCAIFIAIRVGLEILEKAGCMNKSCLLQDVKC
jgi:hypothetical protein